jgi:O-antigen/teichoic acid export membrane protein
MIALVSLGDVEEGNVHLAGHLRTVRAAWQTVLRARDRREGSLGRVFTNLGWLLGGKAMGAALSLVYLALAARSLGPEGFGEFALILGGAQAISAVVSCQTWQIVVRYGLPHVKDGRAAAAARLAGFCLSLDMAGAVTGCAIAALAVMILGPLLGWSAQLSHAGLAFSFVILLSGRSTAVGILRLHDRFGVGATADTVTPIMRFVGALAVVAIGATVHGFLVAWAIGEIMTALAYWACVTAVAPGSLTFPSARTIRLALRENTGIWRFTWMTNLNVTLDTGGKQMVVLLVGLMVGPVGAGHYRLANQLAQALARISDMGSRAIFPELARAYAGNTGGDFKRLLARATGLASLAGITIVFSLLALGHPLLGLIAGRQYAGTYPLLLLLGVAAALDLASVVCAPALIAMGKPGRVLLGRVCANLCLFGSLAILVPWLGTIGAAYATIIASGATLVLFGVTLWRAVRTVA